MYVSFRLLELDGSSLIFDDTEEPKSFAELYACGLKKADGRLHPVPSVSEERGQGEAIARNILEMARLKVPIITIIIGEGASGGALGIGVGDKVMMLENTWYSVISPESCSSILWRSWEYKEQAADALKLTATDMKRMKLVDQIIKEPIGGAHANREKTFASVKTAIVKSYEELKNLSPKELVKNRMNKYDEMGVYKS